MVQGAMGEIRGKFATTKEEPKKSREMTCKPSILLIHKRNAVHHRQMNGIFVIFVQSFTMNIYAYKKWQKTVGIIAFALIGIYELLIR